MVVKSLIDGQTVSDLPRTAPEVVVVDPCFDAYADLVASARKGRIGLHLRSSGMAAVKLARRLEVDAWIVAAELDDMSGSDFVGLLEEMRGGARVAMVNSGSGEPGVDQVLARPITFAELEDLVGLPAEERSRRLKQPMLAGPWVALPVSVGAAVVALAFLMVG
jgi:hypothetical protein